MGVIIWRMWIHCVDDMQGILMLQEICAYEYSKPCNDLPLSAL